MASAVRVPKPSGAAGDAAHVTASEAKNGFGRVLDRVAKDGAVVITKHDRPDAVILSIEAYERLASAREPDVDALAAEFDALYERMQEPGAAAKMAKAFAMKPDAIGRVALDAARARTRRGRG
jgi:prevent-host-death family protein